ncbi:undecaprenyl diphosphate synthase family protein [Candidatus Woesearchaeota archaeon]|nr:undecaprenyl diphosphate synthase family protein [Candidatus Woesearchaeota archaeon]
MDMIKHLAVSLDDILDWCRKNSINAEDGFERYFNLLARLMEHQIRLDIPILTVYLLPDTQNPTDHQISFFEHLADFFENLSHMQLISGQKIKISIFGKWYKLPGKAIEAMKKVIDETKDYDSFFTNFCINYDGQEEIVDACKLIAKQVELGKLDAEMITKETIKENIYSSYFLAPDAILIYGERKLTGILLWDSNGARVIFTDKSFVDFEDRDLERLNLQSLR